MMRRYSTAAELTAEVIARLNPHPSEFDNHGEYVFFLEIIQDNVDITWDAKNPMAGVGDLCDYIVHLMNNDKGFNRKK